MEETGKRPAFCDLEGGKSIMGCKVEGRNRLTSDGSN
jgi:hypothetical protein